jgi:hypothetical protein
MEVWRRVSSGLVLTAPLIIIIYDVMVFVLVGKQATISEVVRGWAEQYHDLPYVTAGLFVWLWLHLFFEVLIKDR